MGLIGSQVGWTCALASAARLTRPSAARKLASTSAPEQSWQRAIRRRPPLILPLPLRRVRVLIVSEFSQTRREMR